MPLDEDGDAGTIMRVIETFALPRPLRQPFGQRKRSAKIVVRTYAIDADPGASVAAPGGV